MQASETENDILLYFRKIDGLGILTAHRVNISSKEGNTNQGNAISRNVECPQLTYLCSMSPNHLPMEHVSVARNDVYMETKMQNALS